MLFLGGIALWWVANQPQRPSWLQAFKKPQNPQIEVHQLVQQFDHELAEAIKNTAENGVDWPQFSTDQLKNWQQATVSAQVSTTPQELWEMFRQEGSQAVLDTIGQSAQVSVNDISAEMINEARYQYCQGVIEEYQR